MAAPTEGAAPFCVRGVDCGDELSLRGPNTKAATSSHFKGGMRRASPFVSALRQYVMYQHKDPRQGGAKKSHFPRSEMQCCFLGLPDWLGIPLPTFSCLYGGHVPRQASRGGEGVEEPRECSPSAAVTPFSTQLGDWSASHNSRVK